MKLSYNWLKSYINLDLTPSELGELLTGIGLEVGGTEQVESVKGGLEGLVIGEVVTCGPHPDSDHLSVTTVDIGTVRLLPVVCGAPNVAAGQKVVVAPVGAKLYGGAGELIIKKAKIRGEVSEGMICSELETGLGTDGDGIMVLPSDAPVGKKAGDYFRIENDWVFEIDITPNRIDSASYLGVAKDLAAFLGLRGEKGWRRPSVDAFTVGDHSLEIPVEVLNPEACPRYSGLTISGVEVKESPAWLRQRLKSIGLTPVNNVVDITNFVLFETGQPLHAFDASEITGGKVIVKTLPSGTRFTTLDGTERVLEDTDLMICNSREGMCIGGVYGGLRSGVSSSTTDIFLESACFDPIFIRKTSRKHGLYTDASFRFERGTDINGTLYALKRAALLITEVAGGVVSSGIRDVYPNPVKGFPVEVSWSNIRRLIGKELGKETIKTVLNDIEIKIEKETERGLSLLVPTSKVDVRRECDVIEEILRFYGYNNVEIPDRVNAALGYSPWPDPDQLKNIVSEQLVSAGFYEIWSNSLTRASYYDEMSEFTPSATVKLYNPLSRDLNGMRQTLLFGGLECIVLNSNRKNNNLRLFEFGNTYFYHGTRMKENPAGNYHEEEHLALFLSGSREVPNWTTPETPVSFFLLKSYVDNILLRLGYNPDTLTVAESRSELFSEGIRYESGKNKLAELGVVTPSLLRKTGVETEVYYADLDWGMLLSENKNHVVKYSELPKYPEVRRDLALVIDKEVRFARLKELAFRTEKHLLRKVSLFDIYEGKGIPEGKKSYAISFVLRDDNKTLNDRQIEKAMERLLTAFTKELGAALRG